MPRKSPTEKLVITLDRAVHEEIRDAARAEGLTVSAFMTAAARRFLRLHYGLAAIAEWKSRRTIPAATERGSARRGVTPRSRRASSR